MSHQPMTFESLFPAITGNQPFPWQTGFYNKLVNEEIPSSAQIPTGLGKTSIVAIWLIALALRPDRVPRRLVYVVNRRTVVDQTTTEVERLREALTKSEVTEIRNTLASLCALPLPSVNAQPLAISTLRGQFADNGEWCADPSRPAVVIGTVDMIGSGLLFSRYTRGFKTRPLHAGFLAQDALLVHDEAHLEPSFQSLLESIVAAQRADNDPRKLRLIELTATRRVEGAEPFGLDENPNDKDTENEIVKQRINAVKRLSLVPLEEGEKLDAKLIALAKEKSAGRAVLVFVRSVETAVKIAAELDKNERKGAVATLTGTMRGKERDELVSKNPVFHRFLPESNRAADITPVTDTVFLVATSAGEVGVNISADDLICDLSTYESMAQRFGRVNRFGDHADSGITVVHEREFDTAKPLEAARARTLALLGKLDGSASPAALDALPADERAAAFSPPPTLRIATAIQFDAWALTSIREPIAARPPVAPYLHGEAEWQPPETRLAWRDDRDFQHIEDPEAFLDDFPLKPVELLRDTTPRIAATLAKLLNGKADLPDAWLVTENGAVMRFPLSNFDKDTAVAALADTTLILPSSLGGLDTNGHFNGKGETVASDVSGIIRDESTHRDELPDGATKIIRLVEISDEDAEESKFLRWCEPATNNALASPAAVRAPSTVTLAAHTADVVANATAIAAKLFSEVPSSAADDPDLRRCLILAARLHDLGKNRAQWQRNLGNTGYDPAKPETILAKSAPGMRSRNVAEHYRHEFGSLNDAARDPEAISALEALSDLERDIVLHLIAAHHGRARPHFPAVEIFDDAAGQNAILSLAIETPRRFARLQKHFGRWGLAWLESLLRAADYAASAGIVANGLTIPAIAERRTPKNDVEQPTVASLTVNPTNPGHYFACCGLFELASRLSTKALAWFEQDTISSQWRFHITNTPPLADLLAKITSTELSALDPNDATASPIFIGAPFNLRIDWWKTTNIHTSALKVWAGTMEAPRIARAMQKAIHIEDGEKILSSLRIAYAHEDPTKKVEPFYFDANRGPNSDARDVGFSANDLKLETLAAPAAEFLTLVGLQRAIPQPSGDRLFDYHLWQTPIPIALLAAAINGFTEPNPQRSFRFESWFRTSQRKHKAFLIAKLL